MISESSTLSESVIDTPGSVAPASIKPDHRDELQSDREKSHLKFLAEIVPVGVLCTNLQDGCEFVNQEWLKLTDTTRDEFCLKDWMRCIHADDRKAFSELKARAILEKKPVHLECRLQDKSGRDKWAYVTATDEPLTATGSGGIIYCLIDLTEKKNSLRQVERAHRLNSIGVMAGGIAHDLNNALTPVIVGLEMLRNRCPDQIKLLDSIYSSAKHGASIVKQLMTFAKGTDGERIQIQLRHLLRETEKIITSTFPKNIRLNVVCGEKNRTVMGDPTQLQQVILNLCVNARDAMPDGGTITIELDAQEVDALFAGSVYGARPGQYLSLKIRDNGSGISPEIIDRIFDPFFTTKSPDRGTGLGLSTALGIIKKHEGFIQVYSQVGKGATFGIFLPMTGVGDDTKFIKKSEVQLVGNGQKILFVDDEPIVREVVSEVLKRMKFQPILAVDGADGLVKAMENISELKAVITDMHMPHMDGLALVHAIRRIKPQMPVLVASGRLDGEIREQMNGLNAGNCIQKPFTESQLVLALQSVLAPVLPT